MKTEDHYISQSTNIRCHSPHQRKSSSLVPGHDQSSPLLWWRLVIHQVFSHLRHSLYSWHLSVQQPNPLLSCQCSLSLCSVMKIFVLTENNWGLAGQTAAPWWGSGFERSWAEQMVLWTQRQPPPAAFGQRRGAGPGLHIQPLRFLASVQWGQGSVIPSQNSRGVPASHWLRFCEILSSCWLSHSQLHSTDCCPHVTHCAEIF